MPLAFTQDFLVFSGAEITFKHTGFIIMRIKLIQKVIIALVFYRKIIIIISIVLFQNIF